MVVAVAVSKLSERSTWLESDWRVVTEMDLVGRKIEILWCIIVDRCINTPSNLDCWITRCILDNASLSTSTEYHGFVVKFNHNLLPFVSIPIFGGQFPFNKIKKTKPTSTHAWPFPVIKPFTTIHPTIFKKKKNNKIPNLGPPTFSDVVNPQGRRPKIYCFG